MSEKFNTVVTFERHPAKGAIKAVLHAILFQRAFGNIVPGSTQVCGVTLPVATPSTSAAASQDLDQQIDMYTDEIYRAIDRSGATYPSSSSLGKTMLAGAKVKRALAVISFCAEKVKRTWYSKSVEEIPWEEFHILFEITTGHTERERNNIDALTRLQLSSFLMSLVSYAEGHKVHTPPITTNEIVPFPWRIEVKPE